jgi:hypothetical protein
MLADVSPREFDELIAFRRIEPDPDERQRQILKLGFAAVCSALGRDISPEVFDPWDESQSAAAVGPAQAAAAVRSRFGSLASNP